MLLHCVISSGVSKPEKKVNVSSVTKKNQKNNLKTNTLATCDSNTSASWIVHAESGFILDDGKQHAKIEDKHITLSIKKGRMNFNGKKLAKNRIIIKPHEKNTFLFEKQQCEGFLIIDRQKDQSILLKALLKRHQ